MPIPNREYRDLDLDFSPHPITGQLPVLTGTDAIRRAIKQLVLTSNYERYFRPWLGSIVHNSLFSPNTTVTQQQLRQSIIDVITGHEPRAENIRVNLSFSNDRGGYTADIYFNGKNLPEPVQLSIFLRKTR